MLKKLIVLSALLLSTNALCQQAIIYNESTKYDQSFHYQIGYDQAGAWMVIDDKTITIPMGKYSIIKFPVSPLPDKTMINAISSTEKNGATGEYYTCVSGANQTNVAVILNDHNASPLVTCEVDDYTNEVK